MSRASHTDVIEELKELGFTQHGALIYIAVLKHGECSAGVVLDDVKLHREQVYRALKRLVDQGLLTQFEKRKRSYYSAVDPTLLVNRAKSKVSVAESLKPYLLNLHQKKPQIIKVTEGEEAIKLQFEDVYQTLKQNGEYLVLGGVGQPFYNLAGKYIETYQKKFTQKNIAGRVLVYGGSEYPKDFPFGESLSLKRIKRGADLPASTVIYANKVGIDILDPDNIAVITIENEKVSEAYRQTFEALWK